MIAVLAVLLSLVPAFLQNNLPHAFPREGAVQLLDNERVTLWEVTWAKGKPTAMHEHKYDMVCVDLADSTVKVTRSSGDSQTTSPKAGGITFVAKGTIHAEEGMSDPPRHAIMIDLKDAVVPPLENKSGYPSAFPRDGAKKIYENARVVVWDYRWTLGKPSPMHFHDKDVVVVYMDNGSLKSTTPDGKSDIRKISFAEAQFNPRNRIHTEELVEGAARAIVVELK